MLQVTRIPIKDYKPFIKASTIFVLSFTVLLLTACGPKSIGPEKSTSPTKLTQSDAPKIKIQGTIHSTIGVSKLP